MTREEKIKRAADLLWETEKNGGSCEPVRLLIGETDLELAYTVQAINTNRKLALGEHIVGAKIGLTSAAVQKQLGVDQPDFGMLTNRMDRSGARFVPWAELHQPKVEMEVAFLLGKDLDQPNMKVDQISEAIMSACAAMEIVGSRIQNWNIKITDTIADNASASHFVLGSPLEDWKSVDLVNCKMEMRRAGEVVSTGSGAACMGNPLNAVVWLANKMYNLGTPLKAGYIILAGAVGPMVVVEPGDSFEGNIEGFGSVSVSFGKSETQTV